MTATTPTTTPSLTQRVKNFLTPVGQSTDKVLTGFTELAFTPEEKTAIAAWDTDPTGAPVAELLAIKTTHGSPLTWNDVVKIADKLDKSAKETWIRNMGDTHGLMAEKWGDDYFEKFAFLDPATGRLTIECGSPRS